MDSTDQPNSICQVERIEMYQLPPPDPTVSLPFSLLDGEAVNNHGTSRDGLILITNYRLYLHINGNHHHVPLGLIEMVELKELDLHINCKDCRTYRCTFESNESCLEWCDKINKAMEPPKQLNQLFAFFHFAHYKNSEEHIQKPYCFDLYSFTLEMDRLKFEKSLWRISQANVNYELCPSYPPYLLVPREIDDEDLKKVAKFRSSRRIPAVVWRHAKNGAVIARCSQPEVGWFGWRGEEDEKLIQLISKSIDAKKLEKRVLILDARSYTFAVANRARGGGYECPEYYSNCEVQFMNLANIHSIRKSFHALRALCASTADVTWNSQLENTKWFQHMSGLLKAAAILVTAVDSEGRPVVVHCSDGWDRTPQIVALSELILDPYYRTMEGFRVLIEREWLAFGHKFADRCGHSTGSEDSNERCPIFLQWLDCVYQLLHQYPCEFEFSEAYLVKLAQHTYSNLFGTFLCNTLQERLKIVNNRTFSVWEFLNTPRFKNNLYDTKIRFANPKILWPHTSIRDLIIWRSVYFGTMEAKNFKTDCGSESCPGPPEFVNYHNMTKTRSYNDLAAMSEGFQGHFRRSSDPSMNNVETNESTTMARGAPAPPSSCSLQVATTQQHETTTETPEASCRENDEDARRPNDQLPSFDHAPNGNGEKETTPTVAILENGHHASTATNNNNNNNNNNIIDDVGLSTTLGVEKSSSSAPSSSSSTSLSLLNGGDPFLSETCTTASRTIIIDGNKVGNNNIIDRNSDDDAVNNVARVRDDSVDHAFDQVDHAHKATPRCPRTKNNNNDVVSTGCGKMVEDDEEDVVVNGRSVATCYDDGEPTTTRGADFFDDYVGDGKKLEETSSDSRGCRCYDDDDDDEGVGAAAPAIPPSNSTSSIETSCDTLVPDKDRDEGRGCSNCSSPKEINGFERIHTPSDPIDIPDVSKRNRQCENGAILSLHSNHYADHILSSSELSNSPMFSRTSSSNGWDNTLSSLQRQNTCQYVQYHLGEDGLIPLRSSMQERISKIIEDGKKREEKLEKEIHTYRQVLINQTCLKCSGEKFDDNGSIIESVGSTGEGEASAVESLPSDKSWENLDYTLYSELQGIKWVPDHAVTRCTNCNIKFWIGKRKHHCRKCGNIFCADCSENSTPLPSEQLYDPVRVCTSCFNKLRREGETLQPPSQCKQANHHHNGAGAQPDTRITASSN